GLEVGEGADRLRVRTAPAFGIAEIADRAARVEREVQAAASVARAQRDKGAGRAEAYDIRDAVAIDVTDDARRLRHRPALVGAEIRHRQIELAEGLAVMARRVLSHRGRHAEIAEGEDVVETGLRIGDDVAQGRGVGPALRLAEII